MERTWVQRHLATPQPAKPGPLPRAQHDRRDARVHADQRPDPEQGPGDARHQHVRPHVHAADQRDQHGRRAAHRTGHLGERPPHHRSQRSALGRADGVDPARHRRPRSGRRRGPPRWPSEHPRQQHPAVLLRQPTAGERRLQLGRADLHRAQRCRLRQRSVSSLPASLRRSSRTPTASFRPRLRARFRARP